MFLIRPYHPSDLPALYRVCLLTGDAGNDASAVFQDHELLGHLYVGPYVVYEPELAWTLTHNGAPVGYVIATRDTSIFLDRCERDWLPPLRVRYPLPDPADSAPDASLIRSLHALKQVFSERAPYQAHLHIDLLPVAQGRGWGRRMIATLNDALRAHGAPGVSLGLAAGNTRAQGFYENLGFHPIPNTLNAPWYGMWFDGK